MQDKCGGKMAEEWNVSRNRVGPVHLLIIKKSPSYNGCFYGLNDHFDA